MGNFDPTREEMIAHLDSAGFSEQAGYFDFDRESAIWWFASQWYNGQFSNLYKALCQSPYKPSPLAQGRPNEGEIVDMIIEELEAEFTMHD